MQKAPAPIPFSLSSFPGQNPQEGAGDLVNCTAEPLGEATNPTGPSKQAWHRQPGLSVYARQGILGYRGGLLVGAIAYEAWLNNASTVDAAGTITSLGSFPGSKKVSIARNQNAVVQVVAVDIDNGAYRLSGGGAPVLYNGGGVLPQPNSVAFQDSYFFFTIGDNRVFASGINALTQNANTFVTIQKKADSNLLRGIAFSGLMWFFCTGHCEVWNDTAQPFPAFPYSFLAVVNQGLLQANTITGYETGFDELFWVAQDFGVYWARSGNAATPPSKVSPPDLDRLIQQQHAAQDLMEMHCYAFAGKKFIVISSSKWSWELNLSTLRWNRRSSLINGVYGRWRAVGGHPAFGKWIVGDVMNGNLGYVDPTNLTEYGMPLLYRVESGPVQQFPYGARICRADFNMDVGIGVAVNNFTMQISNVVPITAVNGSELRVTVNDTSRAHQNDVVNISGVNGMTEANGSFPIRVVDSTHIDLIGSVWLNPPGHVYTFGGTAIDVTSEQSAQAPTAAISCSRDGGLTWGNPMVRQLGLQGRSRRARVTVKNMGLAPPLGARWRVDITDEVQCALLSATQSSSPTDPGAA